MKNTFNIVEIVHGFTNSSQIHMDVQFEFSNIMFSGVGQILEKFEVSNTNISGATEINMKEVQGTWGDYLRYDNRCKSHLQ